MALPENPLKNQMVIGRIIGVLSLIFLIINYGVYGAFHYPSAPGGDLYNHYQYILDLQKYGISHFFLAYPRLFHLIVLIGMSITGLPAIKVMLFLVPLVLLAVALAGAWVAYLLVGEWGALITFLLLLLVSGQPLQTLYDGGFPNVMAANIWLPLWVGSTYLFLSLRKVKWLLLSLLFAFLIVATHHFTVAYLLGLVSLLILRYSWRRPYYLVALLVIVALVLFTPLGSPFYSLLRGVASFDTIFPWVHLIGKLDNSNAIWRYQDYPVGIGILQVYGGLAGLIVLIVWMCGKKKEAVLALLIFGWIAMLLLASRVEALGFPVRLARDAGVPLAISAATLLIVIWKAVSSKWTKAGIILVCFLLTIGQTADRFNRLFHYEPTMQYTIADQAALERTGNAPTAVFNQLLPTTIRSGITNISPQLDSPAGQELLRQELVDTEYIYFDIPRERPDDPYSAWLTANGFSLVLTYGDPLKSVPLFQRNK